MKRRSVVIVAILSTVGVLPMSARSQSDLPQHPNGSLGFHTTAAPLGGRWWFGAQKVGIDFGLGFSSTPAPSYDDESLMGVTVDVGVPIVLKNWDKVHLMFRPGLLYATQEEQMSSPPDPFDSDDATTMGVTLEIEGEVFIVDNFSVSASHGIGFFSDDPAGPGDSRSSFTTLGNNFSHIGFHVYFFGGGS
jgi:hypothetical protein